LLIDKIDINISDSKSIISFETEGNDSGEGFDRYLAVVGERAFHIGNVCDTCSFFFERLGGANRSINAEGVVEALNDGLTNIDIGVLDNLKEIIPNGKYYVLLSEVNPTLTKPSDENDYFSKEQIELWGINTFWGMPHNPKTEYYRLSNNTIGNNVGLHEFLIPMYPSNWLDNERVSFYRSLIKEGKQPTLVALSILDIKQPADKIVTSHWCLANYLIDGHHKVCAAALEGKSLTMISFLSIEQGISTEGNLEQLVNRMKRL
jgi:hypothetical protein